MGGKKEKRGRREEDRVGVGVDSREVDAGDGVENGVDKVDRDKKKGKTERDVLGNGSEFVAEYGKGSVGDENEGDRSEKKKKKRKREVGRDEKELEKAVKKGSTLSEGNESGGGKSVSEVPQIVEDGDGHTHDDDFENMEDRLQIQTKKKKNKKHKDFKEMDDVDAAFSATKHFADDRHEAGVQEQNKSLGKNIEEIKDTDEGSIKKKKKKKGRRDSDPVGDNQKEEEASRSSDAEIAKKDIREKERSKRKKQKRIKEQVASGMESEADARSEEKKPIKDRKKGKKDKAANDGIEGKVPEKKRVRFDEIVRFYPPSDGLSEEVGNLVSDKKLTKEEDGQAVHNEAGVQEQNKSLGKNIEEIKDTDEGGIKKKKKKKGRRDSDPVGDNQKKEEASRSSDAEIAKKDIREKERSEKKKQKWIEEQVDEAGVIFTITASEAPLFLKEHVQNLPPVGQEVGGLRLFIDISVPRNVSPCAADVRGSKVYNVDDLKEVVAANKEDRLHKAMEAQTIVAEETKQFEAWRDSLETVPTIKKLRAYAKRIRIAELEKCLSKLGDDVPKKTKRAVDDLSRSIVNKLLHGPMQHLRCDGDDGRTLSETLENMHALNRIFSLDTDITLMEQKIKAKIEQSQK